MSEFENRKVDLKEAAIISVLGSVGSVGPRSKEKYINIVLTFPTHFKWKNKYIYIIVHLNIDYIDLYGLYYSIFSADHLDKNFPTILGLPPPIQKKNIHTLFD